ncbi:MAG: hypothetical protein AAB768_03900 [Patescibacteria group bacterium]
MKIFIYGVPGSGKTYYSKLLGKKLNLLVFEADKLKKGPLPKLSTCLAYEIFGKLTTKNVIKGLLLVRDTYRETVEQEIMKHDDLIMEGAFLDPNSLLRFGKPILLVTLDETKHKKQYLKHREKLLDFQGNEFRAARAIQEYLIIEAARLGIEIIANPT